MKTVRCDRCGKIITRHPLQQAHFPSFAIYLHASSSSFSVIDLCDDCEDALYSWINEKEKTDD